jgi:hypothetical protein
MAKPAESTAEIGFPVKCAYKGGIVALGGHGNHLWIRDGKLGHGELSLTHGIPLSSVSSIDVVERATEGSTARPMLAEGVYSAHRTPAVKPKQYTEINVRTHDGQVGLWIVENRGGEWVRDRIAPALQTAGISL